MARTICKCEITVLKPWFTALVFPSLLWSMKGSLCLSPKLPGNIFQVLLSVLVSCCHGMMVKWPISRWRFCEWGQHRSNSYIDAHITVKFFIFYIHLHCLLLHTQHCCHLFFENVANKIQESLHSDEYYHKDGIKSEVWWKTQTKLDKFYFGDSPPKSGTNGYLTWGHTMVLITSFAYGLNMYMLADGGKKLLLLHVVVVWCFKLFSQPLSCPGHKDRAIYN